VHLVDERAVLGAVYRGAVVDVCDVDRDQLAEPYHSAGASPAGGDEPFGGEQVEREPDGVAGDVVLRHEFLLGRDPVSGAQLTCADAGPQAVGDHLVEGRLAHCTVRGTAGVHGRPPL
jgi:hypothetical protein